MGEHGGEAAEVINRRLAGSLPLRRRASEPEGRAALLTPPTSASQEGA